MGWTSSRSVRIAGVVSLVAYVIIHLLAQAFTAGAPMIDRPILAVLAGFFVAFCSYLIVVQKSFSEPSTIRLRELFVFGLLFRIVIWPSVPIQEVDIYRYVWDGAVGVAEVDPYRFSPQEVIETSLHETAADATAQHIPDPNMRRLVAELDQRPGLRSVAEKVHYPFLTTPYPPVSQYVFRISENIAGPDASEQRYLIVHKAIILLFDIVTAIALIFLLGQLGRPRQLFVTWWWCPLVIKEFANSGHLDSIAVALTTIAALLLVMALKRSGATLPTPTTQAADAPAQQSNTYDPSEHWQFGLSVVSCVVLALAVGAKLYPIVLAPIWAVAVFTRFRFRVLIAGTVFCVATLGVCWPMFSQTKLAAIATTDTKAQPEDNQTKFTEHSAQQQRGQTQRDSGIEAFYRYWEMNDLIYMAVVENLKPNATLNESPPAWFVVTPDRWRHDLCELAATRLSRTDFFQSESDDSLYREAPFLMTRFALAIAYLAVMLWLCWRVLKSPDNPQRFLESCFLTLAWLWLLGPVQNPWYWTWVLPFLPFVRNRCWLLVSGLTFAYYLRFWFNIHFEQTNVAPTAYAGTLFFDFVVPWLEFGPFYILLAASAFLRRRKERLAVRVDDASSIVR